MSASISDMRFKSYFMLTVERKVTKSGPHSFSIALPAIWRKNLNLSEKDHLVIEITEESLTVRPKREAHKK